MLGTLMRRVAIQTLDTVVERGKGSGRGTVRVAAGALDKARQAVGLQRVERVAPLPDWEGAHPDRPMWRTDQRKMEKWQVDTGIKEAEGAGAAEKDTKPTPEAANGAPIKIFYKRGCPYARAAFDLLRERDIAFEEIDIKGDEVTTSWLKIVTGKKTNPQIFLRGELIGGYDELREFDLDGKLAELSRPVEATPGEVPADASVATSGDTPVVAKAKVKLPVLHPETSPFEALLDEFNGPTEELEGDALVARVREVLDECRPMVQADGGDIELLDVQHDVVHLRLTGNCVGCPSSQATLKQGIERRLTSRIPQLRGIESPQLQ